MSFVDRIHGRYHSQRRVHVLARRLADLAPADARILDVGCGDGQLAYTLRGLRPDLEIEGIDVLLRGEAAIPVHAFDGRSIPFEAASFDATLAVDVLHHAEDPSRLLGEMSRVARRCVLLKDHLRDRFLAEPTLRLMDFVGNARHGVSLPYHYWTRAQWREAVARFGLREERWEGDLRLYPGPLDWVFGGSLHFIARLRHASDESASASD